MTEQRLADDQFPRLMNKQTVAKFLGIGQNTLESLIKYDGLNEAAFKPSNLNNTMFIKQRVVEWERKVGL
ncbi:hypothetical protein [Periweissella ghanensis]|uniref:DNA-binding protein n=1 Tax=Periweissella ghanensis TaxID=467997 RepID=A0ABN8BSP9_9LACO|nr:hypothetical protein [Periweissella ghanensis]MCM0600332.1 hypothetical protein [Periweissella ghanensis]CAH0419244.1 hypothetical protein WGH24286_01691 [Periweissella ghanensis]